jgi:hypothetical protein
VRALGPHDREDLVAEMLLRSRTRRCSTTTGSSPPRRSFGIVIEARLSSRRIVCVCPTRAGAVVCPAGIAFSSRSRARRSASSSCRSCEAARVSAGV